MLAAASFSAADYETPGHKEEEYETADCDADFGVEGQRSGGGGCVGGDATVYGDGDIDGSALEERPVEGDLRAWRRFLEASCCQSGEI